MLRHPLGRTITNTDNTWFTLLTVNSNPIHFDHHYAAQTEWGQPLVNSTLTLAIVVGLSVADVSQHAINLGWQEIAMPAPVFAGDTLYAQSEVLSARESKSRPTMGIVEVRDHRLQAGWHCSDDLPARDPGLQARIPAGAPDAGDTGDKAMKQQ